MVQARARLNRSGLRQFVSQLYAMPAADVKLPDYVKQLPAHKYRGTAFHELEHEKPHVDLAEILWATGEDIEDIAERACVIGDNSAKDMGMARINGCVGFHARWDQPNPNSLNRISKFAPDRVISRNMKVTGGLDRPESTESAGRIIAVHDPRALLRFF